MQEPQTYSSPWEAEKEKAIPLQIEESNQPRIVADPLNSFETYHSDVRTELSTWMSATPPDRMNKAKKYAKFLDPKDDNLENPRKIDRKRRHKILNYIVWYESIHPHGSRDVAAIAFNGLFGVREK